MKSLAVLIASKSNSYVSNRANKSFSGTRIAWGETKRLCAIMFGFGINRFPSHKRYFRFWPAQRAELILITLTLLVGPLLF